jgi:hypothetical protein
MSKQLIAMMTEKATRWFDLAKDSIEEERQQKIERIKNKPMKTMDNFFKELFNDEKNSKIKFGKESGADDFMLIKERLSLLEKKTQEKLDILTAKYTDIISKIKTYKYVEKDLESDDDYAEEEDEEDE